MRHSILVSQVAVGLLTASAAHAALLYNAGFDIVGPSGPATSYTGVFAGPSAADGFEVFNNHPTTTRTTLEPTTLPLPGASPCMIHVATGATGCGLDELFGIPGQGPGSGSFSVWLYVVRGTVGVGMGDGGNVNFSAFNSTHNKWELVTGTAANVPVNNFIIYSDSPEGAEWYADMATAMPTPGTLALVSLGVLGLGQRRRGEQ